MNKVSNQQKKLCCRCQKKKNSKLKKKVKNREQQFDVSMFEVNT